MSEEGIVLQGQLDELVTTGQAAKAVGRHQQTIIKWLNDQEIVPVVTVRGIRLLRLEDVMAVSASKPRRPARIGETE